VVLGAVATVGAAWAGPWCDLSAAGSVIEVHAIPTARGGYNISSDWTQSFACDTGDSDPQVCWTCQRRLFFVWVPGDGDWLQLAIAGPAQGWVKCNRTWTAPMLTDAWGIRPPGKYRVRTQVFQGGRCSLGVSQHDQDFSVP
jgi:hypothetical protein